MALFKIKKNKKDDKLERDGKLQKSAVSEKEPKKSMKELYGGAVSAGQKKSDTAPSKETTLKKYRNAYRVLVKPLVTEKATNLGVENKYLFEISIRANKVEVAKAIEAVYGIRPLKVNIINNRGKRVRSGRIQGKRKNWKKAIVTLPKGKAINIYEGV